MQQAGEELRDEELRGLDLRAFINRRLSDLDHVVGATIGAVASRLNTYLRTEQGPGVTGSSVTYWSTSAIRRRFTIAFGSPSTRSTLR